MVRSRVAPKPEPDVQEDFELDEEAPQDELEELADEEEPEDEEPERTRTLDTSSRAAPHYLQSLLALPGVPQDILEGINPAAAWITVITRDMPAQAMPLGHLAPDALATLEELGYERHARFELKPTHNSPDIRYFAAVLPDLPEGDGEDDPGDQGNGVMIQLARSQEARMDRLEALVLKLAEGNADPFAQIERALAFVERITESVGSLRGSDGDADIIKTAMEQLIPRFLPAPKDG